MALGPDGKHLWVVGDHLVEQAKPGDLVTLFTGRYCAHLKIKNKSDDLLLHRGIVRSSLCLCLDHSE